MLYCNTIHFGEIYMEWLQEHNEQVVRMLWENEMENDVILSCEMASSHNIRFNVCQNDENVLMYVLWKRLVGNKQVESWEYIYEAENMESLLVFLISWGVCKTHYNLK